MMVKRYTFLILTLGLSLLDAGVIEYINSQRTQVGLRALKSHSALEKAAQNHANFRKYTNSGHYEAKRYRGFTGVTPQDRAIYAGYGTRMVLENISDAKNSLVGVEKLFGAIYHRFGFLDFLIDEIGWGRVQSRDGNSIDVYNMGNSLFRKACQKPSFQGSGRYFYGVCKDKKKRIAQKTKEAIDYAFLADAPEAVLYPYFKQRDVLPVFYEESPDPLPDYSMVGYALSIQLHPRYEQEGFFIADAKLKEQKSQKNYELIWLEQANDPHHEFKATQFALFAKERLEYGGHYVAQVVLKSKKGVQKVFDFDFYTKNYTNLRLIEPKQKTLALPLKEEVVLYFKPKPHMNRSKKAAHARFRFSYTQGLKFSYDIIDSLTLKLRVKAKKGMKLRIINDAFSPAKRLDIVWN